VTILIRALGFATKAPNPGYYTDFSDDDDIPSWAKDSIYVAREINLIQGDNYNRINPDEKLTRAEASAMLVRFLEFLQKDLQKDYRDSLIF
ncbi:MAG: S-layer homology domain-containing protein, partial [Bryobacteraceae bacterium]|nr:S-layer homology domain-containing protein [Bryobacteraceae bacterium]